jgi:hypothetical protein
MSTKTQESTRAVRALSLFAKKKAVRGALRYRMQSARTACSSPLRMMSRRHCGLLRRCDRNLKFALIETQVVLIAD